jgi:hypothetical protein
VIVGDSNCYSHSEYVERGQTKKERKNLTGPRRKEAISFVFLATETQHVRNQIASHILFISNTKYCQV